MAEEQTAKATRGACAYCGRELTRTGMARHLKACPARKEEIEAADERPSTLCEAHAGEHPHDDYGDPMPLVNSPRVGMCGYEGPAEPPY